MKKVYIIAAISAVITGILLFVFLTKLEKNKSIKPEYETIVVAAQDIPAFTSIKEEMIKAVQIPKGGAHEKVARETGIVIGSMCESQILSGEQIIIDKLKNQGENKSGIAYIIPEKMRAISIAVDDISGVSGFIKQGDYVDIIASITTAYLPDGTKKENPSNFTAVIAENILVAALDKSLSPKTEISSTTPTPTYSTITLIVSPQDAMKIIQSYKNGQITVSLRAVGDHSENDTPALDGEKILVQ
ncbi:MAG: Flp pilus assembly protein CpaB [Clostridiales bacterium]|nr:MAG: Flp pilus assembly protein CpaB [Clostridiales bacterium]